MTEPEIDKLCGRLTTLFPDIFKLFKQIKSDIMQDEDISVVHLNILFTLKHEGLLNMSSIGKKSTCFKT